MMISFVLIAISKRVADEVATFLSSVPRVWLMRPVVLAPHAQSLYHVYYQDEATYGDASASSHSQNTLGEKPVSSPQTPLSTSQTLHWDALQAWCQMMGAYRQQQSLDERARLLQDWQNAERRLSQWRRSNGD